MGTHTVSLAECLNVKLKILVLVLKGPMVVHGHVSQRLAPLRMVTEEFRVTPLHNVHLQPGVNAQTYVLAENVRC
jgi:hypothetical protein